MASEVTIPRLGWNMDEGTFVGWLKTDGQHVAVGEPLFSLEGDKATQDVESLEAGISAHPARWAQGRREGRGGHVDRLPGRARRAGAVRGRIRVRTIRPQPGGRGSVQPEMSRLRRSRHLETPTGSDGASPSRSRSPASRRAPGASPASWASMRPDCAGAAITAGSSSAISAPPPEHGPPARASARKRQAGPSRDTGKSPSRPFAERSPSGWSRVHRPPPASRSRRPSTPPIWSTCGSNSRRSPAAGEAPSIAFTDIIVKLTALALEKHPLLNARWNGDKIVVSSTYQHRHCRRYRCRPTGPGDSRCPRSDASPARRPIARPDRSRPPRRTLGRRDARRHVHGDQPGADGHRDVHAPDQSSRVCHPGPGSNSETSRRRRQAVRRPRPDDALAHVRPPDRRRGSGRAVPADRSVS